QESLAEAPPTIQVSPAQSKGEGPSWASVTANDSSLQHAGKYTEAGTLFRKNLEARRRVLGAEHPDTAGIRPDAEMAQIGSLDSATAGPLATTSWAALVRSVTPALP